MFVFDVHHHVGQPERDLGSAAGPREDDEVSRRLAVMDAEGVDQAFVIPSHSYGRSAGVADSVRVNDHIAAYRDAHADRFPAAACIVEPTHGQAGLEELQRCRDQLGIRAVSVHARFQGISMNDPSAAAIVATAFDLGMLPVVHAYPEDCDEALWKTVQLVRRLPQTAPVLVLDAFSTYESTLYCSEAADLCPNLVFDTALSYTFERIASFTREFGAERVLLGSDTYSVTPGQPSTHLLRQICASTLPDTAKERICGGNARRLFGL